MVPKAGSIDAGPGRPASRKSARRWLAAKTALALSIAMIAGEGLLRLYTWGRGWTPNCYAAQLQLFRPDARCGYDLAPDFRLKNLFDHNARHCNLRPCNLRPCNLRQFDYQSWGGA